MNEETIDTTDIREILRLLPHRYPFVMIDRIVDVRGDEHGIGIKNVSSTSRIFSAIFRKIR